MGSVWKKYPNTKPPEAGEYLVLTTKRPKEVRWLAWTHNRWLAPISWDGKRWEQGNDEVMAWLPKPAPYGEAMNGNGL